MKKEVLPLSSLGLAAAVAAALAVVPPAGVCTTPAGVFIQGWWSAAAFWLYWPATVALLAGCFALWRFAERRLAGSRWAALSPLAWLPVLVMVPHGLALVDHTLAGLVLPLGGAFLAAICLERAFRPAFGAPSAAPRHPARRTLLWFAVATVLLIAFNYGVARPQRFGGGDVKHYRMILDNLMERGDFDLTDRMDAQMDAEGLPRGSHARSAWLSRSHMRVNADGRIYSYHSFGFPLLAWLFCSALGDFGEVLLMALLGALALCGIRASCAAHGAPRAVAALVALLTAFSYVWVYTAMSFLPEMLGFCLVTWAFWAVAAQGRPSRRWAATAVAALACAYLPLAHVRFTPIAGMLAAAFGVEGLFLRGEPFWGKKVPRLAVFSLACFAAWGGILALHASMFSGTSAYAYSRIVGRSPLAMWAMFSDRRGSVSLVPAVSAFLVSAAVALFRRDAAARRAAMALCIVAANLWFCCSTPVALGGACLNGRYFYSVVPVLLPFFAIALSRAGRPGRLWLLFLALLPVLYFVFLAPFLSGGRLIYAPVQSRAFLNLSLLWEPFPGFFSHTVSCPSARVAGSLFAASLFGISALACTRRGPAPFRYGAAACLLAAAFFLGRHVDRAASPKRIGAFDVLMGERHFHHFRVIGPHPSDFFSSFRAPDCGDMTVFVLTDDLSHTHDNIYRMQHPVNLPVDDWRGRPLRWGRSNAGFTSFRGARGYVACRATGRVVRGTAHLALQIDGVPDSPDVVLEEGPFDVIFRTRVYRGNGGGTFLLALENDVGEAYLSTTEFAPCPDTLPELLGGFASPSGPDAPPVRFVSNI